jgi:DNA-binding response OmpR family regulator
MCERCPELKERIAWLESELGIVNQRETMLALSRGLKIRPGAATLLARLYAARGKFVTTYQLLDLTADVARDDDRQINNVSVTIFTLRKALGRDAIDTAYGHGYRLSAAGVVRVAAIVEPQARAA